MPKAAIADSGSAEIGDGLPATASSEEGASVAELAETLAGERPEVQQHAIDQATAESAAQTGTESNASSTDSFGTLFDSAKHTGTKTATGAWRSKKGFGVRGPGAAAKKTDSRLGATSPTPAATAQTSKEISARAGGTAAANLFMVLCIGLGGDEWQPIYNEKDGTNEKLMLETVFAEYFVATGKTDLPPGWALAAGISMYSIRRFGMPKTRNRLQRVKDWISAKILARRAKKRGLRIPEEVAAT